MRSIKIGSRFLGGELCTRGFFAGGSTATRSSLRVLVREWLDVASGREGIIRDEEGPLDSDFEGRESEVPVWLDDERG